MNMEYLKDNEYQYEDIDEAIDNIGDELAVIAHDIARIAEDCAEKCEDVGATPFRDAVNNLLCQLSLDDEDIEKIRKIIKENYDEEGEL